jgi:hypothetical protein
MRVAKSIAFSTSIRFWLPSMSQKYKAQIIYSDTKNKINNILAQPFSTSNLPTLNTTANNVSYINMSQYKPLATQTSDAAQQYYPNNKIQETTMTSNITESVYRDKPVQGIAKKQSMDSMDTTLTQN